MNGTLPMISFFKRSSVSFPSGVITMIHKLCLIREWALALAKKNQSCGRNVHWMMNIAFSFKSKLRLKGFTSQSKIVASSVIMMVTVITKFESHSCFVFTLNSILPACLREQKLFDYSKYKAFSSPSMLDTVVSNKFSLELFLLQKLDIFT